MKEPADYLTFGSPAAWRAWLEEHHATEREAWLIHTKKGVGEPGLSYEEAVEEALCFGWIDGLLHRVDGERYALRYSPRKPRSTWSASNLRRVEKLLAEGRMAPAGLARVAEAKENGEWDAATARENVDAIPADLAEALKRQGVGAAFKRWPASRKKQYLYWLSSAKRPETRQKRLRAIVEMAAAGE